VFLVFLCNVGLIYSVSKHKDYFLSLLFEVKIKFCFFVMFLLFFLEFKVSVFSTYAMQA
jgi:hypothetical protein